MSHPFRNFLTQLTAPFHQADLCHEVRAGSIARQVHGHLELWRGKEAAGAAGLAVNVVAVARGANQVRVARGTAGADTNIDYRVRDCA
jgi:hypothetical protein